MKIVLALGNPGSRYEPTRHNIGWMVADSVAERLRAVWRAGRGDYYEAEGRWRGRDVLLVKPTTFMNLSGVAARQLVTRYGKKPEEMLVVVDELQFPTGRVQLRPSGSDGGHNGLASLIEHLGTASFPRLRCGIGRNFEPGGMSDYVLSAFAPEEKQELKAMIASATDGVLAWVALGTSQASQRINRPAPENRTAPEKESGVPPDSTETDSTEKTE